MREQISTMHELMNRWIDGQIDGMEWHGMRHGRMGE